MIRAILILAVVALAHYAPSFIASRMGDPDYAVRWLELILGSIQTIVLFALLIKSFKVRGHYIALGIFACLVGIYEESQMVVCNIVDYGDRLEVPLWSGLCISHFGLWPYAVIGATALTYLILRGRDRGKPIR